MELVVIRSNKKAIPKKFSTRDTKMERIVREEVRDEEPPIPPLIRVSSKMAAEGPPPREYIVTSASRYAGRMRSSEAPGTPSHQRYPPDKSLVRDDGRPSLVAVACHSSAAAPSSMTKGWRPHPRHWQDPRVVPSRRPLWPEDRQPLAGQSSSSSRDRWIPATVPSPHYVPLPTLPPQPKNKWNWSHSPYTTSRGHSPHPARETRENSSYHEACDPQDHPRVLVAISNEENSPRDSSVPPKEHVESRPIPKNKPLKKRNISPSPDVTTTKRPKSNFDGLELLVLASMEMGPMKEEKEVVREEPPIEVVNAEPVSFSGCSCPKSKCVALYCECFKAGRRCEPGSCTCLDCKNTIDESGPMGARTMAIRSILARNPRAFSAPSNVPKPTLEPGQVACNCVRSRCLKLYCTCFQKGQICKEGLCSCVSCLNTDTSGDRQFAIQSALQKRPDAFRVRVKEVGLGCACKNNRCIRKYCECFRNELACSEKCSCANCENQSGDENQSQSRVPKLKFSRPDAESLPL